MANLLRQTEEILTRYGKAWSDICWIGILEGSEEYWKPDTYGMVSIETFKEMADREYDDGFGGAEVNTHLIIAGDDWWLERGEYNGSEWWEFKTMPKKPGATFIGETTTALTDGATTTSIVINSKTVTAVKGYLVTYQSKEFVFDGMKWIELGDLAEKVSQLDI